MTQRKIAEQPLEADNTSISTLYAWATTEIIIIFLFNQISCYQCSNMILFYPKRKKKRL